ncbi:hypothetical protein HYZ97_04720 [Candidatus Pacearchaeota archaeon]|nr:hypothetical protein [Candidatus Pacearchaeota archaeon]
MERGVEDRNILDQFAEEFCTIVEKHVKYIIVSGFVAISHGRRRATEDIDMIIEKISLEVFDSLHSDLVNGGFQCLQSTKVTDIFEYLQKGDSVRYVRTGTFLPPEMEIKFAKDELDEMQIKTRVQLELTGMNIWFSNIDFNIAFKEELLKSDKDIEDAKHLRIIYSDEIDALFIDQIKEKIRRLRLQQ